MAIAIQSQISNPVTGVFGTGQVQFFATSGTWIVPPGIGKVRVRLWGAGGPWGSGGNYGGGGGGGFAIKAIYDLSGVTSVPVTVGQPVSSTTSSASGGTSSFGSYVSATGGTANIGVTYPPGGTGIGGDVNYTGGYGIGASSSGGGGGAASIFGNGGNASVSGPAPASSGGAGGGYGASSPNYANSGGNGFLGAGATLANTSYASLTPASTGMNVFSIDFIGTGGGGCPSSNGINGGGGGFNANGGFPGGGSGYNSSGIYNGTTTVYGAPGLVIVEY